MSGGRGLPDFGAYIIGDEILSGKRQDKHFTRIIEILKARGLGLSWCEYLGDDAARITARLQHSMASPDIVFSFGGIGATPDDYTRQCAAAAAGVEIERHPGAVAEIEAQFGERAYPKRVLMAEFPAGAELIPNPVNRIPGFSVNNHHFMPGFPEMAWPMTEWVLDQRYSQFFHQQPLAEASILVFDAGESQLLDLMNGIVERFPDLKLFSLPRLDQRRTIELGVKGKPALLPLAIAEIQAGVEAAGFSWQPLS
ncbi:MAG TPA: molybdopterin-binding protein [Methylophilaceae bacterium]|nr:molybdopterin-binding protein [Methylophilaceae bacterium]